MQDIFLEHKDKISLKIHKHKSAFHRLIRWLCGIEDQDVSPIDDGNAAGTVEVKDAKVVHSLMEKVSVNVAALGLCCSAIFIVTCFA